MKLYLKKGGRVCTDKKQIYVVDDDGSVCRALSVLLGTYGFGVKTFNCAEDFFDTVPNSTPGCLLLDIHMPGLDGWEALHRLIMAGSIRPVIIMSADKSGGLTEKSLKAGAVGYLQKPFNDQELVDLIKSALDKRKKVKKKCN